jgi:hypothetical protein
VQKVLEDANDDYNLSHTAQMNLVFFQEGYQSGFQPWFRHSCGTNGRPRKFLLGNLLVSSTQLLVGEGWDSFDDYCSCPTKPVLTSASISITSR